MLRHVVVWCLISNVIDMGNTANSTSDVMMHLNSTVDDELYTSRVIDCTKNIPPPPGTYTCLEQYGWGKCDESWMINWCCISCPEACGCENYEWNNGSKPDNYTTDTIVTLSDEQIDFYQNMFFCLHIVAGIGILLIPLLFIIKWCKRMMRKEHERRMNNMSDMVETSSPSSTMDTAQYVHWFILCSALYI